MRVIITVTVIVLGAFAGACTLIVSNQFSDTDKDQVTDDAAVSYLSTHPNACSLTEGDANTNPCATCIQKNCGSNVAYACNAAGSGPKPWFMNLVECAENPDDSQFGAWGCYTYDDPDAQPPISGMDDTAEERASKICVYNNCLAAAIPDCHQCPVTVTTTGSSGEQVTLDHSQCGQCLKAECGALIIACCDNLPDDFPKCGYTQDPDYKAACLALADAGVPPSNGDQNAMCAYQIATSCFSKCSTACNSSN